jgi:hypothetical protein
MKTGNHYRSSSASDNSPNLVKVMQAYDQESLRSVLEMRESRFEFAYGMDRVQVQQAAPADFYLFLDRGASVLAVAHLDTVAAPGQRRARFVRTEAGSVVFSRALDDRLGAYTILEMLPRLGINVDVLLTTGEESGLSTAAYFDPADKQYRWVIEFDRGGTDVVMYQYDDYATAQLVRASGARTGRGSFSDIAYLDHLDVKCFNWGIGYTGGDNGHYHGPRAHAFLQDTFGMVAQFMRFWEQNKDTHLPHLPKKVTTYVKPTDHETYEEWSDRTYGKQEKDEHGIVQYRNRKKRDWWTDANSPTGISKARPTHDDILDDEDVMQFIATKSLHDMTDAELEIAMGRYYQDM